MTKLEKDFLTVIKNGLHGTEESITSGVDELEQLALTHVCVPFVYRGALNVGSSVSEKWKKFMTVSFFRNQKNLQIQSIVLDSLKNAGIPCAIIKGSTVSVNYPEPMLRTLGDIDILVKPDDYEKAIGILCSNDRKTEFVKEHKFHYEYTFQGVSIEVHKYVTEYTSPEYGKIIEEAMNSALDNLQIKQIDEFEFPSLNNKFMAATLLLHKQRHFFENRLPIRMLCDWTMFIKSVDEREWNDIVYPFIEKMGLAYFCDAVTEVCNRYLGADCSNKVKHTIKNETIENIIAEFLNDGVIKNEKSISQNIASNYSQNTAKSKGKVAPFFMILNNIARNEFSLARKSKIFLPLFWIYIPIRYLFRMLTGKRSKISFKTFNETTQRKSNIINDLKLKD